MSVTAVVPTPARALLIMMMPLPFAVGRRRPYRMHDVSPTRLQAVQPTALPTGLG